MSECGTNSCKEEATHRIFWPGKEPLAMCGPCKNRALGISKAMGFHLHAEELKENVNDASDREVS